MNDLVKLNSGKLTVNSKQVADAFGKTHRHVLRDIQDLLKKSGDFGAPNFGLSSYKSLQNKELPCYEITRDGFSLLAMGFTGEKAIEWKIKYLTAFNEMEKMLSGENSVMKQLNIAVKIMSEDKAIASKCGVGLNKWKEVRKDHIAKIDDLNKKAQLLLNFK
jgi:Rha family phage regulatory protein